MPAEIGRAILKSALARATAASEGARLVGAQLSGVTGTNVQTLLESLKSLIDGKAPSSHSHPIGDLPIATSGTSSTTQVPRADDSRLSDARPPTTHTHPIADLPVAASGTSSATQVTRADDSRLSDARTPLTHGHTNIPLNDLSDATITTPSTGQVLKFDGTNWTNQADATSTGGGYAEVQDEGTALTARTKLNFTGAGVTASDDSLNGRTNIDISGAAAADASATAKGVSKLSVAPATATDPIACGTNDSRLSDARTPTAHTHAIADLPVATSGTSSTTQLPRADDARLSDARTPTAHTHAIADLPVAASGTSSTTQVPRADDSRLSDARTPTAHTHAVADLPIATSSEFLASKIPASDDARLSNKRVPTFVPIPPHHMAGTLALITGKGRSIITKGGTITEIYAQVATAPAGAALNITIKKNGTSVATLSIAAAANSTSSTGLAIAVAVGDFLTVDITQVGSTTAGSDLTICYLENL